MAFLSTFKKLKDVCDAQPPNDLPIEISYVDSNTKLSLSYILDRTADKIQFTISSATDGWVGIGFTGTPSMRNADAVVGWVNPDGSVSVFDSWIGIERIQPFLDVETGGTDNIQVLSYSDLGGVTKIVFERPLITSDLRDMDFVDQDIYILLGKHEIKFCFKNLIFF